MEERTQAVNTDVKRDTGVTITYADGYVAAFDLMTIRLGCPCASCRGKRDLDQETWPLPNSPLPLRIDDAQLHGAWALQITWNDGHSTGLFPFAALRNWHEGGFVNDFADLANR